MMKHARMISQKWMNVRRYGFRAAVLAALLMVICSMGAMAATHTVNTDSRVYRSPDLSSQYVALPEGMQVNLVATYNGWAMIENAGVYGYTNAAHLTENAESEAPQAAVITADTYVFQSPSLSSARLSVPQGMRIELVAVNGDWAMVRNGSVYAYMYAGHVALESEVEPEPTAAPTAEPTAEPVYEGEPAVITADTFVFQSPSLNSASLSVPQGMQVELIAVNGDWAMVRNGSVYAYMYASHVALLSEIEPEPTAAPVQGEWAVVNADTYVYQSPSAFSARLSVPEGMRVELIAVNGDWAMVRNGTAYAYIYADFITLLSEVEPTVAPTATPDYGDLLENAKDAVITANTFVFESPDMSSSYVSVSAGLEVRLLAENGQWALIEHDGHYGYVYANHVSEVADSTSEPTATPTSEPTATPTPVPTSTPDYSDLLENAKDAVIVQDTFVFESPDLSSSYVSVSAGMEVRLLAVNGQWALIEHNGHYGFVYASHVSEAATATPEPTAVPTPEPTEAPADDYLNSSEYSNEEKCYMFLTREMGLNTAAASGILANIRRESSFNPDSGSSYYGLCQWGGGRLTNLRSFCSSNGYSASSLEGQLRFLAHELEQSYSSVLSYLQGVDNSAQGAYDAGYHFCYNYERPANRESSSVSRGELARDTYYPKYA